MNRNPFCHQVDVAECNDATIIAKNIMTNDNRQYASYLWDTNHCRYVLIFGAGDTSSVTNMNNEVSNQNIPSDSKQLAWTQVFNADLSRWDTIKSSYRT